MGIKIGRLDFKAHGLLGTAGLLLLGAALCCSDGHSALPHHGINPVHDGLSMGKLRFAGTRARKTVIARGIVAPHREAYKRAIGVVLYVNVRLAGPATCSAPLLRRRLRLLAARLAPTKAFDNGNTFVFVVPIFCGVGLDAVRQLRCIAAQRRAWNDEVATMRTVAAVQFVALLVSFAFTLGFRGYIRRAARFIGRGRRGRHSRGAGRRRTDGRRGRRNDFSVPPGPLDRRAAAAGLRRRSRRSRPWPRPSRRI